MEDFTSEEQFIITNHTNHEISDLRPHTKYTIWVLAYNQDGPGMNSLKVFARTKPYVPSQPPQNIVIKAISSTEINIRWKHPPKSSQNGVITGYKIRYKKPDRISSKDTITTAGDNLKYTDGKDGMNNITILFILIACGLLLLSCIIIELIILDCNKNKPL